MIKQQFHRLKAKELLARNSKAGSLIPLVETLSYAIEPVEYFAKLSGYGKNKNCLMFESASVVPKYGERSIGSSDPCLKVTGKNENFEIIALNKTGVRFIKILTGDFDFCDEVEYSTDRIFGRLRPKRHIASENERLRLVNHTDILRKIAFKFKPVSKPFVPYCGLFGAVSYDFIDQLEDLPKNKNDLTNDPDYVFYFLDNLFFIDHKENKTYFIANALVTGNDEIYDECRAKLGHYKRTASNNLKESKPQISKTNSSNVITDTGRKEFIRLVGKIKEHIKAGDVYQAVLSRTMISEFNGEPFEVYKKLRKLNPSPYMFYINYDEGILAGASPETCLKVEGDKEKTVEIRPIAGTKPRGIINNRIDLDLDSKYEAELKIDKKEISEHTMLVDLARNDVAKISKSGSRHVDETFVVEKYSHVQHLVSNVVGTLKPNLDALHAYTATMNMGTLTGAPKIMAMKLLRKYEKNKRGFYGGAVCYLTPSGDFDSAILIRSINIKNNKAYVRAGAGIVYDSDPESEFIETERKANACLMALQQGD
ncbi:MAG TPA: anthranilate synthase component 1 [Candidatus Nanoarchaeia archaeon]|nr:anthranilate synthase component 1 [Candidatus Nanoarchaeia archaeon]